MEHTLVALVEDRPGVLNRVASLFRRRAFNIESLTVGHTEQPGVSRMTIVIDSNQTNVERVTANLYKLVNVIQVADLATTPVVSRDLALIKVSVTALCRSQVMQLVDVYRAHVVDVTNDKIDSFVEVMRPFGIVEMVRTGVVAVARGVTALPRVNGNENGNGHKAAVETGERSLHF
jgi:acetolactate synthase-1/3 small subunit